MKNDYTLGLYEKAIPSTLSWPDKLKAAKAAGYDFLEISIDETEEKLNRLDMSKAERLQLVIMMNDIDLPIRTMCLSGHRKFPLGSHDPQIRSKSLEIMKKAIGLAEDLGIRVIQLAGYDVYYEDSDDLTKHYFAENLSKAVEMSASAGVILGFETMETEFMNTVEKTMHYVNQLSSVYLNVYPDIGNLTNAARQYRTDVLEDLCLGKGRLAAMHLKETKPGFFREVPFGEGHVDFCKAIEKAWELDVRKYVAEFWFTGNPKWQKDLIFANQMMRKILDVQK